MNISSNYRIARLERAIHDNYQAEYNVHATGTRRLNAERRYQQASFDADKALEQHSLGSIDTTDLVPILQKSVRAEKHFNNVHNQFTKAEQDYKESRRSVENARKSLERALDKAQPPNTEQTEQNGALLADTDPDAERLAEALSK